jgi:hypothetical protein
MCFQNSLTIKLWLQSNYLHPLIKWGVWHEACAVTYNATQYMDSFTKHQIRPVIDNGIIIYSIMHIEINL